MGVYIELPENWAKWSFDVRDFRDNILDAKVTDLDLVRCGECEYADEYNHCKYSAWWNGNADFCSHGIRRKENR